MNFSFRPYDILTQLIPGAVVLGVYFKLLSPPLNLELSKAENIAYITVLAFLLGYMINAVGHFIESLYSKVLNNKVLIIYRKGKIKFPFILFKPFTKLKYIDGKSPLIPDEFSEILPTARRKKTDRLEWLNQEKKFARSLIITTIIVITMILCMGLRQKELTNPSIMLTAGLLVAAFYRYMQSSIDYVIQSIKIYERIKKINQ